jgi:hypothetical protein
MTLQYKLPYHWILYKNWRVTTGRNAKKHLDGEAEFLRLSKQFLSEILRGFIIIESI